MEPESLRASLSSEWRFFSVLNIVRAEQTNHRHAGLFGPPSTVVCGGVYLALLFSRCLRGDIIFVIVDKAIMAMFGSLTVGITEKTPKKFYFKNSFIVDRNRPSCSRGIFPFLIFFFMQSERIRRPC